MAGFEVYLNGRFWVSPEEVKNPAGTCCLGEIARAIQEAKRETLSRAETS